MKPYVCLLEEAPAFSRVVMPFRAVPLCGLNCTEFLFYHFATLPQGRLAKCAHVLYHVLCDVLIAGHRACDGSSLKPGAGSQACKFDMVALQLPIARLAVRLLQCLETDTWLAHA